MGSRHTGYMNTRLIGKENSGHGIALLRENAPHGSKETQYKGHAATRREEGGKICVSENPCLRVHNYETRKTPSNRTNQNKQPAMPAWSPLLLPPSHPHLLHLRDFTRLSLIGSPNTDTLGLSHHHLMLEVGI